jgi:hypothetical protein
VQEPPTDETAEHPTMAQPVQQPVRQPAPRGARTEVLRKQAPMAAVGAVFLIGGGVAGFALGHATADDAGRAPTGRHTFTDRGPGPGFGPGGHGQWQQGPGQGEGGPGFGQGGPPSGQDGSQGDDQQSSQDGSNGQDTSGTPS